MRMLLQKGDFIFFKILLCDTEDTVLVGCSVWCNLAEKGAPCSSYLVRCGHIVH